MLYLQSILSSLVSQSKQPYVVSGDLAVPHYDDNHPFPSPPSFIYLPWPFILSHNRRSNCLSKGIILQTRTKQRKLYYNLYISDTAYS